MASAIPHVRMRGQVFQYERRVPLEVCERPAEFETYFNSRPLYRHTLGTKDRSEALALLRLADERFDDLVARALGRAPKPVPNPTLRKLADADLDAITEQYRDAMLRPFEKAYQQAEGDPDLRPKLREIRQDNETIARSYHIAHDQGIRDRVKTKAPDAEHMVMVTSPNAEAHSLAEELGIEAQPGSRELGAIVSAIRTGVEQGYNGMLDIEAGRVRARLDVATADAPEASGLVLSDAVERYIAAKTRPLKTVLEIRRSLATFVRVVGDKNLSALTRGDFVTFVRHLAEQKIGGKGRGSIERTMSREAVSKYLTFLRSALNYAEQIELFGGPNPVTNISLTYLVPDQDARVMRKKRPFETDELNRVFAHPWFTGCRSPQMDHEPGSHRLADSRYWAPLTALLTGARAAELGGLMLSEVRLDHMHPHIEIAPNEFRRTKGGYGRLVPILDQLLELGFAKYVAKLREAGEQRLFPDWVPPKRLGKFDWNDAAWANAKLIRAFNRSVVPKMLPDKIKPGIRQEVTFHGFRGAFKSMLTGYQINPNTINEVVGHAKSGEDKSYVRVPIEVTYPLMRHCRHNGLILPTHPHNIPA